MNSLRIGCVKYLNARPLIHGWPGAVDFDHPSVLCRKLARGDLEVALVSSIEYLRRPDYRIIDGVSISAFGPVYSVIIAHEEDISFAEQIEIDPASQTSVALLHCLLVSHGWKPRLTQSTASRRSAGNTVGAKLLIGDQAIRFRQLHPEYRFWDLAEEWRELTGLPFVFALWLVRSEVANPSSIGDLLRKLRDHNLGRMDQLIAAETEFDAEFILRYFCTNLRFEFGAQEKAGLREFHRRCVDCDLEVAPACELHVV